MVGRPSSDIVTELKDGYQHRVSNHSHIMEVNDWSMSDLDPSEVLVTKFLVFMIVKIKEDASGVGKIVDLIGLVLPLKTQFLNIFDPIFVKIVHHIDLLPFYSICELHPFDRQ